MIIRTLTADDLADWRAIRLEALKRLPEAFLTTYAEERQKNDADVSAMLDKGGVLGAFSDQDLAAVLSLDPETRTALAHRAWINAVYVRPDWQGSDVAHQLLSAAILQAKARGFVVRSGFTSAQDLCWRGVCRVPYGWQTGIRTTCIMCLRLTHSPLRA